MANAVWISIIGMGLVFLGLMLLWGLMALLVHITSTDRYPRSSRHIKGSDAHEPDSSDEKNLAAAIAVAAAFGLQSKSMMHWKTKEEGGMTPWQIAHRNYIQSQKQSIGSRKG
jgi:Na+-transporting methylmalonyl-CoA/oxaloacetate decarboxylase gamma subunit